MKTKIRVASAAGLVAGLMVAGALPAGAHSGDELRHVLVFQGDAVVGGPTIGLPGLPTPAGPSDWAFAAGAPTGGGLECVGQNPCGTPLGNSAFIPGNPDVNASTDVCKDLAEIVGGNGDGAGPADCVISAEGKLGAVASPGGENLGPWCGFSQGYAGHGNLALDNTGYTDGAGNDHILEGIGWLASAGSILPVTAHWQDNPADATADGNGTLVALVQAFGAGLAADCAAGTAGVFNVRGVAAAV